METQYNDLYRPICLAHFAFPKANYRVSQSPLSNNPPPDTTSLQVPKSAKNGLQSPCGASVALVGAGPGAADLLTLRALTLLQSADVILYDGLVNPEILLHAPPNAQCINVGKHGRSRIWKQPEIHQEILLHYRAGKRIVRLKGGDPAVFARTSEELEFLWEHGIIAEIVPGITAALALPAYTGIPLTHRDHASAVALITGQQAEDSDPLDWQALAHFPGTLVLYMGVTTAATWSQQLLQAGKSAATPVALVRRISWPDQQIIHSTLGAVAEELTPSHKLRPPVLVVVGEVAHQSNITAIIKPHLSSPDLLMKPLHGRNILVTRSEADSNRLASLLQPYGASIVYQPLIQIEPCPLNPAITQAIETIQRYAWLIFTSAQGVEHFFAHWKPLHCDARKLAHTKIACVGPATAESLAKWNLVCDFIPPEHNAHSLGESLPIQPNSEILWVRGSRSKDSLREIIPSRNVRLDELIVYESRDVTALAPTVLAALQRGDIAWLTLTSSAIAKSAAALLGPHLSHVRTAALSPQIASDAASNGANVSAIATQPTLESLVDAILAAEGCSE